MVRGEPRCSVKGCKSTQQNFFRFPRFPDIARQWAIASGNDVLIFKEPSELHRHFMCGLHFIPSSFTNSTYTRLNRGTVPSANLPGPCTVRTHCSKKQDPIASLPSPHMEPGSTENPECNRSHLSQSQEPTPYFVSCTIKTEPQDVDPSFPPYDETSNDILESRTSTVIKCEPMDEQMDGCDANALGDWSSQKHLQGETGWSALEKPKSEFFDSDDGAPFEKNDYDTAEEFVVVKCELEVENEDPGVEGERCSMENSQNLSEEASSLSHATLDESALGENKVPGQCSEQTPLDSSLVKHVDIQNLDHKQDNPLNHSISKNVLECSECKKMFECKDCLVNRMGGESFLCSTCNKANPITSDGNEHTVIQSGAKEFTCSTCNKEFLRRDSLVRHFRIHTPENANICTTCNKAFGSKYHLEKHSNTHTGEKPFFCVTCNRAFKWKDNFKNHLMTHTREDPFLCSICNKGYQMKRNLENHLRIHSGEGPYLCSTCNKTFTTNSNLRFHSKIHSEKKQFVCSTCKKVFIREDHFLRHSKIHIGKKVSSK